MNIFALDDNPKLAARYACDQHVVKMPLETAQLLCTARHVQKLQAPYGLFNPKHPCGIWTQTALGNYLWLLRYGLYLSKEYTERYGRIHKSFEVIHWCAKQVKEMHFPLKHRTPFIQCMPDECKVPNDPIAAYRKFYCKVKVRFARWTRGPKPDWFEFHTLKDVQG